jgi:hypothetical protein
MLILCGITDRWVNDYTELVEWFWEENQTKILRKTNLSSTVSTTNLTWTHHYHTTIFQRWCTTTFPHRVRPFSTQSILEAEPHSWHRIMALYSPKIWHLLHTILSCPQPSMSCASHHKRQKQWTSDILEQIWNDLLPTFWHLQGKQGF